MIAKHYIVEGRVQGVSFRHFVVTRARALGVIGWVRNLPDGTVEAIAAGQPHAMEQLEDALRQGPMMARVDHLRVKDADTPKTSSFDAVTTPR